MTTRAAVMERFHELPVRQTSGAFKLLLLFLLLLYANPALLIPASAAFHPTEIVAILALALLITEKGSASGRIAIGWPEGYLLLAFFGAAGLSCFTAFWVQWAAERLEDLARIVLIYFLIVNTVDSVNRLRTAILAFVVGGLFPALGTINSYMHGDLLEGSRAHWIGVFYNPNELAYCLVILVPLAVGLALDARGFKRVALWGIVGVYSAAIYLTYSRGGLLGFFAVLGLLVLRQRKISTLVLVAVLTIATAAFMNYGWQRDTGGFENVSQDFTFQQRISTIKAGIAMFLDRPLTGVGIDCSIFAYPVYAPGDLYFRGALITHNTIVQALSETGLLGFIPYVLFHLTGLSRARAVRLAAGGAGKSEIVHLAGGLGIGLVGFAVCGLSGGYVMSWFPYLFVGLLSRAYAIHV